MAYILSIGMIGLPVSSPAVSLSITGSILETVGSDASVPSGGTTANTDTWSTGTVGIFEMNGGDFYMRVSATNPTGSLSPGTDSLMVARTVNSQGLTDTGTLSILIRRDTTWTLDLNFSFFTDVDLTVPAPLTLLLTSLDIDFNQQYFVSNSSFQYSVTSDPTNIVTMANPPAGYTGFTAEGNANFSDPKYAVASVGSGSSFDVRVAHNSNALYMFEFRDPSIITGLVPEPASSMLVLSSMLFFSMMRRRSHA